jgi:hypothetical protein
MSIDADTRDTGQIIDLRAAASLDELERLLAELERLLREHSVGSEGCTSFEDPYRPKRGSMDEYLEFVAILEDTRTTIGTALSELRVSGATNARLKRVAADLEGAAQSYRNKSNAMAR